jgi:hypothetical protein
MSRQGKVSRHRMRAASAAKHRYIHAERSIDRVTVYPDRYTSIPLEGIVDLLVELSTGI